MDKQRERHGRRLIDKNNDNDNDNDKTQETAQKTNTRQNLVV